MGLIKAMEKDRQATMDIKNISTIIGNFVKAASLASTMIFHDLIMRIVELDLSDAAWWMLFLPLYWALLELIKMVGECTEK